MLGDLGRRQFRARKVLIDFPELGVDLNRTPRRQLLVQSDSPSRLNRAKIKLRPYLREGAMHLRSLAVVACCAAVALSVTASAAVIGPTPDASDRPMWLVFCIGFYTEVERQASLDGNALLYQRARESIEHYDDEVIVLGNNLQLVTRPDDLEKMPYWRQRGANAAGSEFWDKAPLFDEPGQPPVRTMIVAMRSDYASACDKMAEQSSLLHSEAEAMRRRWQSLPFRGGGGYLKRPAAGSGALTER